MYNRQTMSRLYNSIGLYNQYEAQLDGIEEDNGVPIAVMICPICGKKYRLLANRWKLTRSCQECHYIKQTGHAPTGKTHQSDKDDLTDAELNRLLNPASIWKRICERNIAERHEELDDITIERKEML